MKIHPQPREDSKRVLVFKKLIIAIKLTILTLFLPFYIVLSFFGKTKHVQEIISDINEDIDHFQKLKK